MFTGRLHHGTLMERLNSIKLEFFECDEVRIDFCGSNTHLFNRLFAVIESDGNSKISGCGKSYTLQKDCVYFLSAGNRYDFKLTGNTLLISFHFNLFCSEGLDIFSLTSVFAESKECRDWITGVQKCIHEDCFFQNAFVLHSLIMTAVMKYIGDTDVIMQNSCSVDAKVFKYLHENASAVTTISDLADIAGCSADSLSRYFSRTYNKTLKKFLDRAICARAERLLRNRMLKIREIAEILNFRNEFYFNTFFKRETGKTPGSFRSTLSGKVLITR